MTCKTLEGSPCRPANTGNEAIEQIPKYFQFGPQKGALTTIRDTDTPNVEKLDIRSTTARHQGAEKIEESITEIERETALLRMRNE